jgi:hypothetical protein
MALTNFDFPGVTLTQVFSETVTGTVGTLGVACVGQQYKTHNADYDTEAAKITAVYDAANGLTTPLPGLVNAANIDTDTAHQRLVVKNGVFSYFTATAEDLAPTINGSTVTFNAAVTDGGGFTAAPQFGVRGAQIGDVVILKAGEKTVTTEIIGINTVTNKGYAEIRVADAGTIKSTDSGLTVTFCLRANATYAQGSATFSIGPTGTLTINGGLVTTLTELSDMSGTLVSGDLYIEYREKANDFVGKFGVLADPDEVKAVLGAPSKDNPLALAVFFALSASKGTMVYFTGVKADDVVGYAEAFDFLENYPEVYSLVPASENADVIRAALSSAVSASEDEESKVRRVVWFGITPTATGDNYDIIEDVVAKRYVSHYRAVGVWADDILYNGEVVPNFAGAAAAAGMRSYEPCHRPISNLEYTFFSVAGTHGFTRSQLKQIGKEGIWIIGNNSNGMPINMKQVTTAVKNNINLDEESIVSNADEVCLSLCHVGENYVGNSNISGILMHYLKSDIELIMDAKLVDTSGDFRIGAQLLSWKLLNLYQDSVNLDWVWAELECEPPKPFNKFKMVVRIV